MPSGRLRVADHGVQSPSRQADVVTSYGQDRTVSAYRGHGAQAARVNVADSTYG